MHSATPLTWPPLPASCTLTLHSTARASRAVHWSSLSLEVVVEAAEGIDLHALGDRVVFEVCGKVPHPQPPVRCRAVQHGGGHGDLYDDACLVQHLGGVGGGDALEHLGRERAI